MPSIFLTSNTRVTATANALKLPKPEVIALFRLKSDYSGEFGFDWIRCGDTAYFWDTDYEDVVKKHFTDATETTFEMDGNEKGGHYAAVLDLDGKSFQYEALKRQYAKFSLPWAELNDDGDLIPAEYIVPWVSLYTDCSAELKIKVVISRGADHLAFDSNDNYLIEPSVIDVKGKNGQEDLDVTLRITCIEEHTADLELVMRAYKNERPAALELVMQAYDSEVFENESEGVLAGKLKMWANGPAKRKKKKVVFVQVLTPEIVPGEGERSYDPSNEKVRVNSYTRQALIELDEDSEVITMDLIEEDDFGQFILNGRVVNRSTVDDSTLDAYLKTKLGLEKDGKFDATFFKAFYFGEGGLSGASGGGLSGYSRLGADFVVVFSSANQQTASHEILHSFNLPHSFTNKESSGHALFTYEALKTENLLDYSHQVTGHTNDRRSLWYWQWVKANDSIT